MNLVHFEPDNRLPNYTIHHTNRIFEFISYKSNQILKIR